MSSQEDNDKPEPTDEDGLTVSQSRLLVAILNHPSIKAAAASIGMSEEFAYRALKKPHVKSELRRLRGMMLEQGLANAISNLGDSIQVLGQIVNNKKVNPMIRTIAAKSVCEIAFSGAKVADFNQRIEEVEASVAELRGDKRPE